MLKSHSHWVTKIDEASFNKYMTIFIDRLKSKYYKWTLHLSLFYICVILFIVNFDPYVIAYKTFWRFAYETMQKKKNKKKIREWLVNCKWVNGHDLVYRFTSYMSIYVVMYMLHFYTHINKSLIEYTRCFLLRKNWFSVLVHRPIYLLLFQVLISLINRKQIA